MSEAAIPQMIVGLGNPGDKYHRTRHNVGFDIVDVLAQLWQVPLVENRRFQGACGETRRFGDRKVVLLKPSTYMNRSGQSVRAVTDWFKLPPETVLVIYDDMDLPVGKLRLRPAGSAGGHNGMKSIIAHLGTQNFPRLRIGIGTTEKAGDRNGAVISHVLGKFSPLEQQQLGGIFDLAVSTVEVSLKRGVEPAMNLYNGRSVPAES
ncbi:MAG: aminoacyl-tRNA hydrolase [Leptolyngbyaceae cyanobacterium SM1_1_3]|nr:aminoacyl-tRNA hydrolase [Leptolyngbyaceae cyanobacterium SM1_1_3]NJN04959.1 aminoacyl-tRNA hydrolase [Leptolyngbyaceae cyanobacterium RM1_1_2]